MSVRMQSSMTSAQYINERVVDVPLRILNRGPEYLRSRMMNRDSALFHHNRRSAVELLAESKPQYIKSPTTSPENKEDAKNRLCAGVRREAFDETRRGNYATIEGGHSPVDHPTCWDQGNGKVSPPKTATTLSTPVGPRPDQTDRLKTQCHKQQSEAPSSRSVTSENRLTASSNKAFGADNVSCPQHSNRRSIGGEDVGQIRAQCSHSTTQAKPVVPPKPSIPIKPPPVPAKPCHCTTGAIRPSTLSTRASDHVTTSETAPGHIQQKHQKRPRYNGTVKAMAMDIGCSHSNSHSDLKPNLPTISMEEWQDSRTDTSSDRDRQSSQSSIQESATVVRRRHRKAISRSRSDLTKRFSNSSDFSELSAKFHRNSAELEKFFNEMGLDQNILEPMKLGQSAHAQSSSSLNLFESVSCMGSTDARSCLSDESHPSDGHARHRDGGERTPGGSSVERNARIIKWLCGIKVASTSHSSSQQTVQHQNSAD
ncbi:hypothetical protein LSH36_68g03026 [Paralvinella palmiformis]|uniref:Centrosome-associated FAM110 C-terminal domain-containing protein n=1 Tax=Paralvinella palmiformis TaxID=53620 RepID=A0AAD9K3Y8_9ANNE|nr:hypothetical protein LSH36_68g03026 [Paralvinella palmiformis]